MYMRIYFPDDLDNYETTGMVTFNKFFRIYGLPPTRKVVNVSLDLPKAECYKTRKECKYNCMGLCKDAQ